jgi:hypothetical protein
MGWYERGGGGGGDGGLETVTVENELSIFASREIGGLRTA